MTAEYAVYLGWAFSTRSKAGVTGQSQRDFQVHLSSGRDTPAKEASRPRCFRLLLAFVDVPLFDMEGRVEVGIGSPEQILGRHVAQPVRVNDRLRRQAN